MKTKITALILGAFLLLSCGRTDSAYILNNTNDTLTLTMTLNYPFNEYKPDNYFGMDVIHNVKSNDKNYKLAGDYLISYDSISNIAILALNPKEKIELGTIREFTRNDYRTWEFTDIKAKGRNFEIYAKDAGIMTFVEIDKKWYTQDSHHFIIGQKQ